MDQFHNREFSFLEILLKFNLILKSGLLMDLNMDYQSIHGAKIWVRIIAYPLIEGNHRDSKESMVNNVSSQRAMKDKT